MSSNKKSKSAGSMLIQSLPSLLRSKGSQKSKSSKDTANGDVAKTKEKKKTVSTKESSSKSGNGSRESSSSKPKKKHVVVNGNATIGHVPPSGSNTAVDIRGRPIVRKKWRPLSYAEPGSKSRSSSSSAVLQGNCFGTSNSNNKNGFHKEIYSINNNNNNEYDDEYEKFDPRIITRLEADLFAMDQHYSKMYNGHSVRELEARLCQLKLQQLQRRNSVDFAISCVEPSPMCYSVEEVIFVLTSCPFILYWMLLCRRNCHLSMLIT